MKCLFNKRWLNTKKVNLTLKLAFTHLKVRCVKASLRINLGKEVRKDNCLSDIDK